jgi:pimeloyl-ACP methyl ester carboxylesterase
MIANREKLIEIAVGTRQIAGTIVSPDISMEGTLFIHGWSGNREQYLVRAREISALGCVSLTFDLHGHAATSSFQSAVTREDNLADVVAAYDLLAGLPNVNKSAIGVVGSSYGGYLAAILTTIRPVRWLALRAPALYRDAEWKAPKGSLDRADLAVYRRENISPRENRALEACSQFEGDVLIVESEHDSIVPAPVTANYRNAFTKARSLTFHAVDGADHALSDAKWQDAYTAMLTRWAREVILKSRHNDSAGVAAFENAFRERGLPD